jgi:hypothetical protein
VKYHGASPWHPSFYTIVVVAANMKYHGASPWHLSFYTIVVVAANVKYHGASPWHLSFYAIVDPPAGGTDVMKQAPPSVSAKLTLSRQDMRLKGAL